MTKSQDDSWIWLPDMRLLTLDHFFSDLTLQQLQAAEHAVPEDSPLSDWLTGWQQDVASHLSVSLDQLLDEDGGFRL